MGRLKRVIIYGSGALFVISFVWGIISCFFDGDVPLVIGILYVTMALIWSTSYSLWGGYDDDGYYYPESSTEPEPEKKFIVITDNRCSACGAPLEDELCRYCGTRAVIYKTIT